MSEELMKEWQQKHEAWKEQVLKVRGVVFYQIECFSKMMPKSDDEKSFGMRDFFDYIDSNDLTLDYERREALAGPYRHILDAYQKQKDAEKETGAPLDERFKQHPDQVLEQIGFYYDIYIM